MFDPTLYLVINPGQCRNGDAVETAIEAIRGGVTAVQLRNKPPDHDFQKLAKSAVEKIAPAGVPVFINDHVDIAQRCLANGVHLGQSDMPAQEARERLGAGALIGITIRTQMEARSAPLEHVDYVSIGGVYPTVSKSDAGDPIGPDMLRQLAGIIRLRRADVPVIAISGINENTIGEVLDAGVSGVAVISAICAAASPRDAAMRLRRRIDEHRSGMRHAS